MVKNLLFLVLFLAVLGGGSWYGLSLIAEPAKPATVSVVPAATSSAPAVATSSVKEATSTASENAPAPAAAPAPAKPVPSPQQVLTPQQLLTTPPSPFAEVKGGNPPDLIIVYLKSYIWLSGKTGYFDLYRSTTGEKGPWTKIDSRLPGDTRSVNDSGYNTAYTNVYYYVVALDTYGNESAPSPPSRAMKY